MAAGVVVMVTTVVAEHPVPNVYVISTVPAATPVTTPFEVPTVAIEVLLLVHVPPPASVKLVVEPVQAEVVPVIEPGNGLTVTEVV
jgi:hypothetical protein